MNAHTYLDITCFSLSAVLSASPAAQGRKMLQNLQYIPTSNPVVCGSPQSLQVTLQGLTSDYNAYGQAYVGGSVLLLNGAIIDIPISSVVVTLYNNVPVSPVQVTAECAMSYVPANPTPNAYGQMTCFFSYLLPRSGPASYPSAWTSAKAVASVPSSGPFYATGSSKTVGYMPPSTTTSCPSSVTPISYTGGSVIVYPAGSTATSSSMSMSGGNAVAMASGSATGDFASTSSLTKTDSSRWGSSSEASSSSQAFGGMSGHTSAQSSSMSG